MAERGGARQRPAVGRIEWAVGALGATIVVAVLGALVHEALTHGDGPPVLIAKVASVTRTEGGFVVRFRTENHGASTAAEVKLRATLTRDGRTIEEAETTLDYVARESDREAGVILKSDPAVGSLEISATSYRKP